MARNGDKRRFFEVSVHQDNIKAFSTSLHLLQKIGKEMTLGTSIIHQRHSFYSVLPKACLCYRNGRIHAHVESAE
jgi:hypothetical protein